MNKKILLFCLMIFCNAILQAHTSDINTIESAEEETTTIYQELETFYNNDELTEKNLNSLLTKHDIYNIDELLYLLNGDKKVLTQEVNDLKRALTIKSLLLGCLGTFLGYTALSNFINKEKIINDATNLELRTYLIQTELDKGTLPQDIKDPYLDFGFAEFTDIYKTFNEHAKTTFNETTEYNILRREYYNVAKRYHPDKNTGNLKNKEEYDNKIRTITDVYNILKNSEKRTAYNKCLGLYKTLLSTITKQVHYTMAGFSIFSIGAFSIIPFILRTNNKLITKNNDLLKRLNTIIQHIEYMQGEEHTY